MTMPILKTTISRGGSRISLLGASTFVGRGGAATYDADEDVCQNERIGSHWRRKLLYVDSPFVNACINREILTDK